MTVDLERALRAAGLAAPVRWDEVTVSTNASAVEMASQGAPEWTLVGAGHQTAGRGRRDRAWQDRPGQALMVSMILRPRLAPATVGLLSLLAGAAWAESITHVAGLDVGCKWPNDLVVDEASGRAKVGGVLAQSAVEAGSIAYVVVGSGINLVEPEGVEGAAGIGAEVDPTLLLGSFLSAFADGYRSSGDRFAEEVLERWTRVSVTLGTRVIATDTRGERFEGLAVQVDGAGALVLALEDGERRTVRSEDVEHLR